MLTHSYRMALCLASLALALPSCEIEQIDPPFLNPKENCEFIILGKVRSAETLEPLPFATVIIEGEKIITDEEGFYSYSQNKPIANGSIIRAVKQGHVYSTASLNYGQPEEEGCKGLTLFHDFYLTPKEPLVTVSHLGDTLFINDSIFAVIPPGALPSETAIGITPLYPIQSLGVYNGFSSPIKSFHFEPDGLQFDVPIEIHFKPGVYINSPAELSYFSLERTSDNWQQEYPEIEYDSISDLVKVDVHHFSSGSVASSTYSITSTTYSRGGLIIDNLHCNCECGPASTFSDGYSVTVGYTGTTSLNVGSAIATAGFSSSFAVSSTSSSTRGGSIGKCKKIRHKIYERKVKIKGKHWESLLCYLFSGCPFTITFVIGVETSTSPESCPTTSTCHQGCP